MTHPLMGKEIDYLPIELSFGSVPELYVPHLGELHEHYLNVHGGFAEWIYRRFYEPRIRIEIPFIVCVTEQPGCK